VTELKTLPDANIAALLAHARALLARGEDAAAREAFMQVLRCDPTHFLALNELGNLALSSGYRTAARTAYQQAVRHHPDNKVAHVNLANVLRLDRDVVGARRHYEAALAIDPDMHQAHQGLGWVLNELGEPNAEWHLDKGYSGSTLVRLPYHGPDTGIPVILLVCANGGNVFTRGWLSDRRYSVTAVYAEYYRSGETQLPPHRLIINAIGDADRCRNSLENAQKLIDISAARVINAPAKVLLTRRLDNKRLKSIDGVIVPAMQVMTRSAVLGADLRFPLLLRRPGFHNGEYFGYVEQRDALPDMVASLGGDELLVIEYLNARGTDGMARKYRVMFVDGVVYPLHLAISSEWKVHYCTSAMHDSAALREEERRFLEDMPAVLGPKAMAALARICDALGLEYAGIDFALTPDGSVMLFEANATMIMLQPPPDPMWDYCRAAVEAALSAAARMIESRLVQ
jgi:hypothetical protein